MKGSKFQYGDIFEVPFSDGTKKYFQYVMDDSSLMNSNVIRVFDFEVSNNANVDLEHLSLKPIKFYTHCMIKGGVKLGVWSKVGHILIKDNFIPKFRDHEDSRVTKSYTWYVWEPNKELQDIGELTSEYKLYYVGRIFHPLDIKEWMQTGVNKFYFPE